MLQLLHQLVLLLETAQNHLMTSLCCPSAQLVCVLLSCPLWSSEHHQIIAQYSNDCLVNFSLFVFFICAAVDPVSSIFKPCQDLWRFLPVVILDWNACIRRCLPACVPVFVSLSFCLPYHTSWTSFCLSWFLYFTKVVCSSSSSYMSYPTTGPCPIMAYRLEWAPATLRIPTVGKQAPAFGSELVNHVSFWTLHLLSNSTVEQ